jgi:hypothetical protein
VAKELFLYKEAHSRVWNRSEDGDIRRRWLCFRGAKAVGKDGLTGDRVRRRLFRRPGSELGSGDARRIFLLCSTACRDRRGRAWLGFDGCGLLPGTPHGRPGRAGGGVDLGLGGRSGGFLLRRDGETVGDEVLHGHDLRPAFGPRLPWTITSPAEGRSCRVPKVGES